MFAGALQQTVQVIRLALDGCFRKIICTKSAEVVQTCMQMFSCFPVQECVANRRHKFLVDRIISDNILCHICQNGAARELNGCFF